MNQHYVRISPPCGVQRLARSLRNHIDGDTGLGPELGKNVRQQPGGFYRRRRGENDGLLSGGTRVHRGDSRDEHQNVRYLHTSSLPAVRALPANAKTVALIETLIPTNTAPRAKANDRSPWLV